MAAPYIPPPTPGPQPRGRGRGPLALIALVALVVLCLVAVVTLLKMQLLSPSSTDDEKVEAAETPQRIAAVPVQNGSRQPPEETVIPAMEFDEDDTGVSVTIETTPPGAEVFRSGESIGSTPIEERFALGDVETWQIFMDGYEVEEITVSLDADFHSEIVLKELPPDAPRQRPKRADATAENASTKDDDGGEKKKKKREKRRRPKDDAGRTVINSTTGIELPD